MKPFWTNGPVTLYCASADDMSFLADDSVDCVVTSPPYWGLRNYQLEPLVWGGQPDCHHVWGQEMQRNGLHAGETNSGMEGYTKDKGEWSNDLGAFCRLCGAWHGSLGHEPTPELYVEHLVAIMREVKRVLKPTGTMFLNIGDSYAVAGAHAAHGTNDVGRPVPAGAQPLDMVGIPWRLAFALQADGWLLRSSIIWHKPNPMPESVNGWRWEQHRVKTGSRGRGHEASRNATEGRPQQDHDGRDFKQDTQWADCPGCPQCQAHGGMVLRKGNWRPTSSYEHLFMLAKGPEYWANAEAVREPSHDESIARYQRGSSYDGSMPYAMKHRPSGNAAGRNLRDVWTIQTQPYHGPHFAGFPETLVRPCILAATSEAGNCPTCATPWSPVVEHTNMVIRRNKGKESPTRTAIYGTQLVPATHTVTSWRPSCDCPSRPAVPSVVLDPFAGTGTVGVVVQQLGRHAVLVELSEAYCQLAQTRLEGIPLPLVATL